MLTVFDSFISSQQALVFFLLHWHIWRKEEKEKGGRRGIAVSFALKARGLRVKSGDGKKKVDSWNKEKEQQVKDKP